MQRINWDLVTDQPEYPPVGRIGRTTSHLDTAYFSVTCSTRRAGFRPFIVGKRLSQARVDLHWPRSIGRRCIEQEVSGQRVPEK